MITTIDIRILTFPGGYILDYDHEKNIKSFENLEDLKKMIGLKLDLDLKDNNFKEVK